MKTEGSVSCGGDGEGEGERVSELEDECTPSSGSGDFTTRNEQ